MTRRPDLRTASRRTAIVLAGVALVALPGSARAQGALDEARRLRDAGELELAATVLRQHLARAPGDVDARWLLAETLYWTGDLDAARAEYRRALADRPGDPGLRLDYARFLVETGRAGEADGVLAPVAARPPPGWEAEVRRVERSILAATAPWARVAPSVRDDSQPLTRLAIEAEAGFRPADGLTVAARVIPQRYEGELEFGGESEIAAVEALAEVAYRRAGSPVAVAVAGGVFTRDDPETTDAIGEARLAALLPGGIDLRVAASRKPYLWTVASLGRTVLADGIEVALDRSDAPGWAFEVGGRRETFDLGEDPTDPRPETAGRDDNAVTSAWAWGLAPVWVRQRASFRLGYAFQWEDSEESRFTGGGYDPYYTPEEVRVHNAIAALAVRATPAVTVHADGAVGLFAEERAPRVPPPFTAPAPGPGRGPPGPDVTFVDRDFTPWRARAAVTAAVGVAGELRAEIERGEDAFFEITRGAVSLTWWLAR